MKHNSDARWPLVRRRSCWQARRVRTLPIPAWAKTAIDAWTTAATLSPIPEVTIGMITVNSATSLTMQLTAASNAAAQPRSIVAITGNEQDVLANGLVIR
jgi:hypothetical protein